jgi:uncharacterized protein YggU (UPF0235/DUF167 family)
MTMSWPIESHPQGVLLSIKAVPGGRKNELRWGKDRQLRAVVTQVAEKGKANAAILALLAHSLGLRKSQLKILRGMTSRIKTVLVMECDVATMNRALQEVVKT